MKRRSYFITGTDTGVGKTTVTAMLAKILRNRGFDVGVMKPVETGCAIKNGVLIPSDALKLKKASGSPDPIDAINPYRFAPALSPHVASSMEVVVIDLKRIKKLYQDIAKSHDITLIEGAGGLLTPLADGKSVADLIGMLKIPVIIVAASRLGAINHTLLTVGALKERVLKIKGIILNNTDNSSEVSRKTNRAEIERLSGVCVLGEVEYLKKQAAFPKEGGLSIAEELLP